MEQQLGNLKGNVLSASILSKTIRSALSTVGASTSVTAGAKAVIPTAKTRAALDKLASSTPEGLLAEEVNLRELLQDLFSWDGKNKVNKSLIREFQAAINTEGRYAHAVELTGFLAALAPLLEPDRLARLYSTVSEVSNVYAPAKYTLQLSAVLSKVFSQFSEERIERLARSLWVSTHSGNWWDITLGPQKDPIVNPAEDEKWTVKAAVKDLEAGTLHWSYKAAEAVAKSKRTDKLAKVFIDYRKALNRGEAVNTEPSLFSAYIPWLTINERPESPILAILNVLQPVMENEQYTLPKKPKAFAELFPPITAQLISSFPLPAVFADVESIGLPAGAEAVLVRDVQQLAANANHMGNCTMSYRGQMENGSYALFRITYEGNTYNASVRRSGANWTTGEINSRYNRGGVPAEIQNAIQNYANGLRVDDGKTLERQIIANYENQKMKLF